MSAYQKRLIASDNMGPYKSERGEDRAAMDDKEIRKILISYLKVRYEKIRMGI